MKNKTHNSDPKGNDDPCSVNILGTKIYTDTYIYIYNTYSYNQKKTHNSEPKGNDDPCDVHIFGTACNAWLLEVDKCHIFCKISPRLYCSSHQPPCRALFSVIRHTHTHVHTHTHTRTQDTHERTQRHAHSRTYPYTYMYVSIHIYTCMYVYVYTYIHIYDRLLVLHSSL